MTEEGFWKRIAKRESGCWEWIGCIGANGYGMASFSGVTQPTHRLAWIFTQGPIPLGGGYHGTIVAHKCDNRACCNPDHLFLTDHSGNQLDRLSKGRNAAAVLNERVVLEIIGRIRDGVSARELAKEYGVSTGSIQAIAKKRHWTHLTRDIPDEQLRFAPREANAEKHRRADYAKIESMLGSGKTFRQIAKECGTTHPTVARVSRYARQGVATPFRRMNAVDRERIHDLSKLGHSQGDISKWLGMSQASVSRTLCGTVA